MSWRCLRVRCLVLAVVAVGMCLCAAVTIAHLVPLPERLGERDATVVQFADGTPAHVFLSSDERWRLDPASGAVDPRFIAALLRYEDKRFYRHPGVDPLAVLRALRQNIVRGRVVSGASTLTMQVVRILEPRPRTLVSKALEALRAIQLELRMSKQEILATYLRFAPFGRNIEGVQAAALAYFGHTAERLSPAERAYLIATPQDPNARYPAPKNRVEAKEAVGVVARRLHRYGFYDTQELTESLQAELPGRLLPFVRRAPHAAVWLRERAAAGSTTIRTTLRRAVQGPAERILLSHRESLARVGVYNGSAVIIDTHTAEVVGLVGNIDFWDAEHAGQVSGFAASRSPGSALKPFLYALAIDEGLVLPSYLVQDTPVRYGAYEPRNYGHTFRGLVPLHEALALSLNIPFVMLLKRLGVREFVEFLRAHGVDSLSDEPGFYGLSLAIGAAEVTPLALTALYGALATGGVYRPPRLLRPLGSIAQSNARTNTNMSNHAHDHAEEPRRAFSPEAAYLTREGLKSRDRPDFPQRRAHVALAPEVFWKTGTSYGHRDAWAVGGDGRYAVGVWLGNFDGTPSHALVGSSRAGPVLFDLIDALSNRVLQASRSEAVPEGLGEVYVCALSGRLVTPECPRRRGVLAPVRNLPTEVCQLHRRLQIDVATGYALCPLCRRNRPRVSKTFTVLPTSVRRWISGQLLPTDSPPAHMPTCPQVLLQRPPRIVSPQPGTVLYLIPGLKASDQEIPLEVEAAGQESEVFWFVDGELLKKAAPDERVWLVPRPGRLEIRVVDSTGRSDAVVLHVVVG